MAQNQVSLVVGPDAWVQLTNANVTQITFQVLSGAVFIRYTNGTTPPAANAQGTRYTAATGTSEGELRRLLTDLVSLAGANRVWARATRDGSLVYVDHVP